MAPVYARVPKIPDYPDSYAKVHPDRVKGFPSRAQEEKKLAIDPDDIDVNEQDDGWRHELEHDSESVFWLLLYWAMVVQPEDCPEETIHSPSWGNLLGDSGDRQTFTEMLSKRTPTNLTHSFYEPLRPLIMDLADILVIDRRWLPASDPRNDLYYLNEAFRRLIIKFMIDNKNEEFMHRCVDKTFRKVEGMQYSNAKSITDSQTFDAASRLAASSVKPPVDAANPLVISSVNPPVCGSMNFCLFLSLCLWVYLQAMDDSEMADFTDIGDNTATGDDTDTGDDTEMVDVQ